MPRSWLAAFALVIGCSPQVIPLVPSDGDGGSASSSGGAASMGVTSVDISTTGADSSGSSSSDNPFILNPDGGGCGEGGGVFECDIWAQDCCATDKCVPWANDGGHAWNAFRCVPVAPDPAAPGEPCIAELGPVSGFDDCDATSICWNVDPDTLEGRCVPQCVGAELSPVCPDGTACVIANEGVIALCLDRCDPVMPSCVEGEQCLPIDGDFICSPTMVEPNQPGDPCSFSSDCWPQGECAPGAEVAGCGAAGCCTPYCNHLDGSGATLCAMLDPAMVCEPLYPAGDEPEGLEHLGTCRLP